MHQASKVLLYEERVTIIRRRIFNAQADPHVVMKYQKKGSGHEHYIRAEARKSGVAPGLVKPWASYRGFSAAVIPAEGTTRHVMRVSHYTKMKMHNFVLRTRRTRQYWQCTCEGDRVRLHVNNMTTMFWLRGGNKVCKIWQRRGPLIRIERREEEEKNQQH